MTDKEDLVARTKRVQRETAEIDQQWRDVRTKERFAARLAEAKKRDDHKASLAKEFGVVGHPKLDRLYDIAWAEGHSEGFDQVGYRFGELVELIKP